MFVISSGTLSPFLSFSPFQQSLLLHMFSLAPEERMRYGHGEIAARRPTRRTSCPRRTIYTHIFSSIAHG